MKYKYITTAIDYSNGEPHLGHAYEKIIADVIARINKLQNKKVFFITGLDEHGYKVEKTAIKEKIKTQDYCDEIAKIFKECILLLNIKNDDYIRTTEDRHIKVVQNILSKLYKENKIYKSVYKGFYNTKEETFVSYMDIKEIKDENIIKVEEENYFFKLSDYQQWLIDFLKKNKNFIIPSSRTNQVINFLESQKLNDLCISRPKSRLSWGITLPFDDKYITYVWFDALISYLSAAKYGTKDFKNIWPANYHIIGKDILLPSHSIYWPIILKACNIDLPKKIIVHGWFLLKGEKMSKSIGNTISPIFLTQKFSTDAIRYFLIKGMNLDRDNNFSYDEFTKCYNSDLVNTIGNLSYRVIHMIKLYCNSIIPKLLEFKEELIDTELRLEWEKCYYKVLFNFKKFNFKISIELIQGFLRKINYYIEIKQPWKLYKINKEKFDISIFYIIESFRLSITLLEPIMPETNEKIYNILGIIKNDYNWKELLIWSTKLFGKKIKENIIIFPKIL